MAVGNPTLTQDVTHEATTVTARHPKPYVNPYWGGILLGIVLFLSFFFTGSGLGASGGLNRLLVVVEDAT